MALKLGDILKAKGLVTDKQLEIALIQNRLTGHLLGDVLEKMGFITSRDRAQVLAEQSRLEYLNLDHYALATEALQLVPKEVAEKAQFLPLEIEDGRLVIGITEPGNVAAIDTATRLTRNQPKVVMVDPATFYDTLEKAYFFLQNPIQQKIGAIVKSVQTSGGPAGNEVMSLTDMLIMDGVRGNATDIHVTPTDEVTQVFYRIDGVLQFGHCLPKAVHAGIVSRIKVLSQLDIAEQRLPQDGSFNFGFLNTGYDVRVSTIPTIYGENVVLRVLTGKGALLTIADLGFEQKKVDLVHSLFAKPHGIIIICGPTGSGKTTTLYSALRELNLLERNVLTVEDPVEYKLNFVKQTQVNEKAGYDFALAGRNFMRQDPDVILLGEIRDEETAKIAVRASITGHLVLTTLHTNDAVTAIPRLLDLKVDRYLLSSSLLAIVAQRLVRKICASCREKYDLSDREVDILAEYQISAAAAFRGKGCPRCNGTGYSGRTVIGEVMYIDDDIKQLIYEGASAIVLKQAAIQRGMTLLREDAVRKVVDGVTTIAEVVRVAG